MEEKLFSSCKFDVERLPDFHIQKQVNAKGLITSFSVNWSLIGESCDSNLENLFKNSKLLYLNEFQGDIIIFINVPSEEHCCFFVCLFAHFAGILWQVLGHHRLLLLLQLNLVNRRHLLRQLLQ